MLTGLDVVLENGLPELAGMRFGLITNHTGVDRYLRSVIDLLQDRDDIELVALLGPEHGVRGEAQAGASVSGAIDQRTGLPVHSLYGETRTPTPAMMEGLDALMFDIQDAGVRFYTYVSTMINAQGAAASAGLRFVVLDRPDPIGGTRIEGNMLDPSFESFVGAHPVPIRYGMTVGELARMVAAERGWPEPIVVPMQGWKREWWFDETGLPWVFPSPNLPTLDSVTLYPGTCLIEGVNISEGRGTTRPFELIGAPWLDPFTLAAEMERRDLPGVTFRPTYFTPTFSKHANISCGGVQIHILDRAAMRPVELGIHLLHVLRELDPDAFAWREGREGSFSLDLLLGSNRPRLMLDAGDSVAQITAGWEEDASAFEERRRPFLLYS
jgi:uncharacterized protein YbbC (DUF1343 family)